MLLKKHDLRAMKNLMELQYCHYLLLPFLSVVRRKYFLRMNKILSGQKRKCFWLHSMYSVEAKFCDIYASDPFGFRYTLQLKYNYKYDDRRMMHVIYQSNFEIFKLLFKTMLN